MELKGQRSGCQRSSLFLHSRIPSLRLVDGLDSPYPVTNDVSLLHRVSSRKISSYICHFFMDNTREIPLFHVIGAMRPLVRQAFRRKAPCRQWQLFSVWWLRQLALLSICLWVLNKVLMFLLTLSRSLMKFLCHFSSAPIFFYHAFVVYRRLEGLIILQRFIMPLCLRRSDAHPS